MMYWIYQMVVENGLSDSWLGKFTNLFQYLTFRAGVACVIAYTLGVVFGERVIRWLVSLKVGQPIRSLEDLNKLHETHGKKAGTPTMGGVLFLFGVTVATLIAGRLDNPFVWVVLLVFLGLGVLGFVDDYLKVVKKSPDGLSARKKLAGQLLIGLVAGAVLYFPESTHDYIANINIPFIKTPLFQGVWAPVALVFFAVVITGASNAVNLTDGLDGLATGCTITAALAYSVLCYLTGHKVAADYLLLPHHAYTGELVIIGLALVGAGMGFLWFNCHPAKVFMGDTGSLALGGLLGAMAICCRQEFLLVVIGGVFVMEAMSVILQVGSFKLRGKRIFAMSPIHHHFELKGWHESQVIVRFWILSILFALAGLATLKLR